MKANPATQQSERIEADHKLYKIVAADFRGRSEAFAFAGSRKIGALAAENVEAAAEAMRAWLDQRMVSFARNRVNAVPSAKEFADALNAVLANGQARLERSLMMHSKFRDMSATFADIATRVDLTAEQIERDYLRFARWLQKEMNAEGLEQAYIEPKLRPLTVLASIEPEGGDAPPRLALRPQLAEALTARRPA